MQVKQNDSSKYLMHILNATFFLYSSGIPTNWSIKSNKVESKVVYTSFDDLCFVTVYSDIQNIKDRRKNNLVNKVKESYDFLKFQLINLGYEEIADRISYFYNEDLSKVILVTPNFGTPINFSFGRSKHFITEQKLETKLLDLYKILKNKENKLTNISIEDIFVNDDFACLIKFDTSSNLTKKNSNLNQVFKELFVKLDLPLTRLDNIKPVTVKYKKEPVITKSPANKQSIETLIKVKKQNNPIKKFLLSFSYAR